MIETPKLFDNVSSVRDRVAVLDATAQNDNEVHPLTQSATDNTN